MNDFITNTFNPLMQAVIMALVPIAVAYLVNLVRTKTKVQINKDTEDMLNSFASKAVLSVEEIAANALKTGATKWTASMKNGAAVDKILSMAPTLSTEQANNLVTAAVAGIKGLGASAEVGK